MLWNRPHRFCESLVEGYEPEVARALHPLFNDRRIGKALIDFHGFDLEDSQYKCQRDSRAHLEVRVQSAGGHAKRWLRFIQLHLIAPRLYRLFDFDETQ
jgi:hypothetical protein